MCPERASQFAGMSLVEIAAYLEEALELSAGEEAMLEADERKGATLLLQRYRRKRQAAVRETERLRRMLRNERELWAKGYSAVAGVDEAGRGPLAGPVVAAAVIFEPGFEGIDGLNDSKQLTAVKREKMFDLIIVEALAYGIGSANCAEIDNLNIHGASLLAMRRALDMLPHRPDYLLIDGFALRDSPFEQRALQGGDCLSQSIAAASVLAKVSRDEIMVGLHEKYPRYGFNRHMGYGTDQHRHALSTFGPCPEHRRSFRLDY